MLHRLEQYEVAVVKYHLRYRHNINNIWLVHYLKLSWIDIALCLLQVYISSILLALCTPITLMPVGMDLISLMMILEPLESWWEIIIDPGINVFAIAGVKKIGGSFAAIGNVFVGSNEDGCACIWKDVGLSPYTSS